MKTIRENLIFLVLAMIALNIYPFICEEDSMWINTKWIENFCKLSEGDKPAYAKCVESRFKENVKAAHSDFSKCLNDTTLADTLQKYCSLINDQNMDLFPIMQKCMDKMEKNYGVFTPDDMPDEDFKPCLPDSAEN